MGEFRLIVRGDISQEGIFLRWEGISNTFILDILVNFIIEFIYVIYVFITRYNLS